MFLEKLEIQGFKSFANPATFKFNRELTAIVGPNGSGKSNIADAIRWVLGEQSLKLLRGKKGEDVIFSGSDKKARLGLAEVSLYLNNADSQAPLDYQEIIITRRIFRNGENEYLINKNKVRLIDIQLLLAKANFGQKSYSVIGQGMIDFILMASNQERKEFFDEATGIRQYQIKKEQSINKLISTRENLSQSENILKEIEPRYRFLNRQVKKYEKRKEFEDKLRELQKLYFSKLLNDFNKELAAKNSEMREWQSEKDIIDKGIQAIQKKIENERQAAGRQEIFDKLQRQLAEAISEQNALLKEKAVWEGKKDLDLIKNGQAELVWLAKRKNELFRNQKNLQEKNAELAQDHGRKNIELKAKINRQEEIIEELKKIEKEFLKRQNSNSGMIGEEIVSGFEEIYDLQINFFNKIEAVRTIEELDALKSASPAIREKMDFFYKTIKASARGNNEDGEGLKRKIELLQSSQDLLNREIAQQKMALTIIEERLNSVKENLKGVEAEMEKIEAEEKDYSLPDGSKEKDALAAAKNKEINERMIIVQKKIVEIEAAIKSFNQTEDQKKSELFAQQKELQKRQTTANQKSDQLNNQKIAIAKIEAHFEELNKKISEEWPGPFKPLDQEINLDVNATGEEIERLKNQLNLIGGLDENIKGEYQEVAERYEFLHKEIADLNEAFIGLEKVIQELDSRIKVIFAESFQKINQSFSDYFKILFNGGRAKLVLIKEKEEAEKEETVEGGEEDQSTEDNKDDRWLKKIMGQKAGFNIVIQATPPGKKLTGITMLSGGEKALTSTALICAIINNNPSPFVVLDEIDAALDESNSIRLAKILDELVTKTQFICVTHNRATIQRASILYGITMGDDGVSKALSLDFKEATKYVKNT